MTYRVEKFSDGVAICGDSTSAQGLVEVRAALGTEASCALVCADPPYGNVVNQPWDRWDIAQSTFVYWMLSWTRAYADILIPGGAMYVWGGWGTPRFRPFFEYASRVEFETMMQVANFITWSKRRAYGVQHNYLSTREDMLYMIKGDPKKPAVFNVPLLDTKRGYAGYNKKYPAKSEFYRRTSVWTDVNEIFSGKVHPTQKPTRLHEIMIETNTRPGDWVVDPFAGSGVTAHAARKLGRRFVVVERDERYFDSLVKSLS